MIDHSLAKHLELVVEITGLSDETFKLRSCVTVDVGKMKNPSLLSGHKSQSYVKSRLLHVPAMVTFLNEWFSTGMKNNQQNPVTDTSFICIYIINIERFLFKMDWLLKTYWKLDTKKFKTDHLRNQTKEIHDKWKICEMHMYIYVNLVGNYFVR